MNKGEVPGIRRSKRMEPPSDYVMKIPSFSDLSQMLKKSKVDKLESEEFEAGGYYWKLELYPRGDPKMNEKGHISLYLTIADANALPPRGCVSVEIELFTYDQVRDDYLSVSDGKIKRYHALKTRHGFHQFLPLATFQDPSYGYLVDNSCTFGAEVHVIKSAFKRQKLSIAKNPSGGTYRWKLDNFSKLDQQCYYSDEFTACQRKWKLSLFPNGNGDKALGQFLSLFLHLRDSLNHPGKKLFVDYELVLINELSSANHKRQGSAWFGRELSWGFPEFMGLNLLKKASSGYLENDTLIVEVIISLCSLFEDFN